MIVFSFLLGGISKRNLYREETEEGNNILRMLSRQEDQMLIEDKRVRKVLMLISSFVPPKLNNLMLLAQREKIVPRVVKNSLIPFEPT